MPTVTIRSNNGHGHGHAHHAPTSSTSKPAAGAGAAKVEGNAPNLIPGSVATAAPTPVPELGAGDEEEEEAAGTARDGQLEEYARILLNELEHKNAEIEELREVLEEANARAAAADPSAAHFAPIASEELQRGALLDLAKKVRRLTVALERERRTTKRQSDRVSELESALAAKTSPAVAVDTQIQAVQADAKAVRDRLAAATRKLDEEKATAAGLRAEVARLQRALAAELGTDGAATVARAAAAGANGGSGSGWKGRAQQIAVLRSKNKEMQRKIEQLTVALDAAGKAEPNKSASSVRSTPAPSASRSASTTGQHLPDVEQLLDLDERAVQAQAKVFRKLEARRKQSEADRDAELDKLRDEAAGHTRTVEALQARNRTLVQAQKDLKAKLTAVLDKAGNDDKLIRVLQKEVAQLKGLLLAPVQQQQQQVRTEGRRGSGFLTVPGQQPAPAATSGGSSHPGSASSGHHGGGGLVGAAAAASHAATSSVLLDPAARVELDRLRELRRVQSEAIQAKTQKIAQLEIALQHERRMRAQWHPPPHGSSTTTAAPGASGVSPVAPHIVPPSERDAYEAETARLRSKVEVLRDEVRVLQSALEASAAAKERELAMYCRMLDEAKRAMVHHGVAIGHHGGGAAAAAKGKVGVAT
ncbi:hypothetical protein H9P43_003435 [Blastocladiella emersonii ATCC 22665]|nr:hypothetical protein H9P43_003435 [Blastocladiella emersonii ATCC 22665]